MFELPNDQLLAIIPLAPLVASVLIAFGYKFTRPESSHMPCIVAIAISFLMTLQLLFSVVPGTFVGGGHGEDHSAHAAEPVTTMVYPFLHVGMGDSEFVFDILLRADAMTALMLLMITSVSLMVAIFASSYMHGDPGYARFFAAISLFVFSMCMLVLSGSFLQLFVFWEAVGLCSYLLIGFWFRKPSAAAAAKKAFVVNRIGDLGFLLGIFLVWQTFGTVEFDKIFSLLADHEYVARILATHPDRFTWICLLLFVGAIGKSAQFPLHVWLPDAMEGPTPVSALIHAATMVTAGVYLVARCTPLFVLSPTAQMVVSGVGAITALIAALTALTQHDLKRVLAYSTVSQLGYMFMSLGAGAGDEHLATHAVTFGMFHMFTHAYFKAVLFLSAGTVMHAMGDVIDMRKFSGLRYTMPITHAAFLAGAAALAGVPLLSAFWSKDEILAALYQASQHETRGTFFLVILVMALFTSLLTAFYTFRAYLLTFHGEERFPEELHGHHPHDAPLAMAIPLGVLAVCALGIGLVTGPTHLYAGYLHQTPGLPHAEPHPANIGMMAVSVALAVAGIGVAWSLYGNKGRAPYVAGEKQSIPYEVSQNGFYFDQIYLALVVTPLRGIARCLEFLDRNLLDLLVDAAGAIPVLLGGLLRPLQSGLVQSYALVMTLGLVWGMILVLKAFAG